MFLSGRLPDAINLPHGVWDGDTRVSNGMDPLELGVIAAVVVVVLYWVVVLPAREKKRRERERLGKTDSGAGTR